MFFFGGLNFVEDCNNICCAIFLAITCEKTVPVTHKHNLYALTIWKLFAGNPSFCNDSFVWNHFQPLWSKLVFGYCDRGSKPKCVKNHANIFSEQMKHNKMTMDGHGLSANLFVAKGTHPALLTCWGYHKICPTKWPTSGCDVATFDKLNF